MRKSLVSKAKDAPSAPPAEVIPPARGKSKARAAMAKMGLATPDNVERDPELEGLMSEIEADLREEELRKIWDRYGKFFIAAFIAIIVGVIGFEVWREHDAEQRVALATRYDQAAADLRAGKTDDALKSLAEIGQHSGEGYADVAELQRAAVLLSKNDTDGALAIYKALAANTKTDSTLRDLATLLQALHSFDRAPAKELETMLAPLLNPGNAFNPSALELSALLAAKQGDIPRAAKMVDEILTDPAISPSLRARATDLAAYYKTLLPAPTAPAAKP